MAAQRDRATHSPVPSGTSDHRLTARLPPTLQRNAPSRPLGAWTYEVNARCLEMLAHTVPQVSGARDLVAKLRELSASLDTVTRLRMARRAYLLVDMRFRDQWWWQAARRAPRSRSTPGGDLFPRAAAVRLARAVLMLVWNGLHSNPAAACVLYGISAPVARIMIELTLDDLDEIARRHFRQVKPRWEDRPAVWEDLVLAAQTEEPEPMRVCNLQALRLLTGEFLDSSGVSLTEPPPRKRGTRVPSAGRTGAVRD